MGRVAIALLPVCVIGMSASLVACSSAQSQLQTTLAVAHQSDAAPQQPGNTPQYIVTVKNKGPGGATGVTVRVDLPAQFRYKATTSIGGNGARTQEVDPPVNTPSPVWGLWSLPAPQVTSQGTTYSQVSVTFSATANGAPGSYSLVAHSTGDSSDSDAQAPLYAVQMKAAAQMTMAVTASPASVGPNGTVAYTVTIANNGTGDASGVGVLVALPSGFLFDDSPSTIGLSGNYARTTTINPWPQASEPFFGMFTIPAKSPAGAGILTIVLHAKVNRATSPGTVTVTTQVTDDQQDQVIQSNTAPVAVTS